MVITRKTIFLILLILVLLSGCGCTYMIKNKKKHVTIDRFEGKDKPQIVMYYASWCGFSKSFLPTWDAFASYVKSNLSEKVDAVKVSCDGDGEQMCYQKGIEGYPTVKLYVRGEEKTFSEERKLENLIDFVNKHC